jgi:hypothetical protein
MIAKIKRYALLGVGGLIGYIIANKIRGMIQA